MKNTIFFEKTGNVNELLFDLDSVKYTRLFDDFDDCENDEIIDVTITSSDNSHKHTKFNKLLNKKIKVTVEIINE